MKKEGLEEENPFANLQKSSVLHESKVFNSSPLDTRQCCDVLTKMLYLLHQGESLSAEEATGLFFGVTKLFQSKDATLRRLIFLAISELAQKEDQAFIVISSLEKDINGSIDLFRANAIRVIAKILEENMIEQRERYLRQAIVSKDPLVQSSAITAGIRLFPKAQQVICRWVSEVSEAIKSEDDMVSYHALQLLYMIKANDRRATGKVLLSLSKRPPSSPYAMCLLIRYTFKMLNSVADRLPEELVEFLKRALHHKSSQVVLEAAKALCNLQNASEAWVAPAVDALTDMLNSHLIVERFAAIRVLNSVVDKYPLLVGNRAEIELEHLLGDSNRNIAVLAITTLLKTGVEASVDRLFKQMENFMQGLPDDLKVVLVDAIQSLCLKFPKKYESLMSFLSKALREEGRFEYKKKIVDSMLILMESIPQAQAIGLEHLCEFIEDCEHPKLIINILHVLGDMGPNIPNPSRYIRFIYNRVLLELPQVRAVAVSALTKFGENVPPLRDDILVLLERCLMDDDDIVRDRATTAVNFLQSESQLELNKKQPFRVVDLEHSLQKFLTSGNFHKGFGISMIERVEETNDKKKIEEEIDPYEVEKNKVIANEDYIDIINTYPDFAAYGEKFKSSKAESLTEDESEYQASVIKHIYENHVIFHFIVVNTFEEQILCDATVEMEYDEEMFTEGVTIPCDFMKKDEHQHIFVSLEFSQEEVQTTLEAEAIEMSATLKFTVKEAVEDDDELEYEEGYEDEYELNALDLELKDFVKGVTSINKSQFKKAFNSLKENQVKRRFNLSFPTVQDAVGAVVDKLGLAGVEFSDRVEADVDEKWVELAGVHISGSMVLAKALFRHGRDKKGKDRTGMQIGITSESELLPAALITCIR